jgi:hypothetical protein
MIRADARDPGDDEHQVRDRADGDHHAHVLPGQALPEHEGVLRADRDDQRQAGQEAGGGGVEHTATLGADIDEGQRKFRMIH